MVQQSQKENKACFNAHAGGVKLDCPMDSKQTNKMWSLQSLVMLKCKTRASLYVVQYK